jgi:hypothetical protein
MINKGERKEQRLFKSIKKNKTNKSIRIRTYFSIICPNTKALTLQINDKYYVIGFKNKIGLNCTPSGTDRMKVKGGK